MKFLTLLFLFTSLAHAQTLFERIKPEAKLINFKELKQLVTQNAQSPLPSYLSLGETHAQNHSTHQISFELIKAFKNNIPKRYRSKICLEHLPDLLSNPYYQNLAKDFNKTSVYQYNGPSRTDFKECSEKRIKKYITYSGFYHMLNFSLTFPGEISAPRLAEKPDNFIDLQMPQKKSLFIPQINLYALEVMSTARILIEKITTAQDFLKRLNNTLSARENLINQFEYLYLGNDIYETKMGITVDAKDIIGNKIANPTYFLLTDLEYRVNQDFSFPLLKNFAKRDPKEIELLLKATRSYPIFLPSSAAMLEETANNVPTICYGAYTEFCFPYHAQFLELKKPDEYNLYVAVGDELKCYSRKLGFFTEVNSSGETIKKSYPFVMKNCSEQILKYAE